MRIVYFHQYFSTPTGSAGTRSYEMAQRAISRGHQVLMVCGSAVRGNTGMSVPFQKGRRRGVVDGIDVLEFDLQYSNRAGFLNRTAIFLRFALLSIAVALTEECDVVFATSTPLTAGIPGVVARWLQMPIARMSPGVRCADSRLRAHTRRVAVQIASASSSNQPGCG